MERLNDLPVTAGIDVQADRCVTSETLAPVLQRNPREVADILRNILGSMEFTASAIAMAEAVEGYRFAESTQLSESGFVRERVALLWCIGVLDGEVGVPPPADWRIPAYNNASSVAAS